MSFDHRRLTGTILAGAVAVFFAAPPHAAAQQRQYRVLDVGTLPGGPPTKPYGINNDGAIVGEGKATDGTMHAFIWLPRTLYGGFCPAQSPYDLHALAPSTPAGASKAYEINTAVLFDPTFLPIEAAQIAGQAGGLNSDAFVWTLAERHGIGHQPELLQRSSRHRQDQGGAFDRQRDRHDLPSRRG